jgi:hypothetical protein
LCRRDSYIHHIDYLAVHVQLELRGGRVADAYRLRPSKTWQPVNVPLGQALLARNAVHDLWIGPIGRGRAEEPTPPLECLLQVSGIDQRPQRQRRVS